MEAFPRVTDRCRGALVEAPFPKVINEGLWQTSPIFSLNQFKDDPPQLINPPKKTHE
jgi:hypothetical protein